MIQQIFKSIGVELLISQQKENDAWVEVARARPHRNAASGSKAHGGIDRSPVEKRTETRPVAQMRKDGASGKLCAEVVHQRFVRNTVETIATNPRVKIALRDWQVRCDVRNCLVKGVV